MTGSKAQWEAAVKTLPRFTIGSFTRATLRLSQTFAVLTVTSGKDW